MPHTTRAHTPSRIACLFCAAMAAAHLAHAESFASSASSAGSASIGSVSESFTKSSQSSSRDNRTADGDYKVIDVAAVDGKPDLVQLTLRADALDGAPHEFTLKLPRAALQPRGMAAGDVVRVRNREYGLEFARADARAVVEPFFLVLEDAWHRELDARALSL